MKEFLENIGGFLLGIALIIGLFFLGTLLLKGAIWVSELILPYTSLIMWIVFFLNLFIFLPLAIPSATKGVSGVALVISSYIYGLNLWIWAFLLTLFYWGITGIIIGFFIMGLGFVPIAIIASGINGEWMVLAQLLLLILFTFGSHLLGMYLIERYDEINAQSNFEIERMDLIDADEENVNSIRENAVNEAYIQDKDLTTLSAALSEKLDMALELWLKNILEPLPDFSSMDNIINLKNKSLSGDALLATKTYEIYLYNVFISNNSYLPPYDRQNLIDLLFNNLIKEVGEESIDKIFRYYKNYQNKTLEDGKTISKEQRDILSNLVARNLTEKESPSIEVLIINKSLEFLIKTVEMTVSWAFADTKKIESLKSSLNDWTGKYFNWIENFNIGLIK